MAKRQITGGIATAVAVSAPLLATATYLVLPLVLVVRDALTDSRASGFGRGFASLAVLAGRSASLALGAALLSSLFCTVSSVTARFAPRFRTFYRLSLLVLLFTNPIFLVFGFTVFFARLNPSAAVILASAYILIPLCGLIIQGAIDTFPQDQIASARALGDSPLGVAVRQILPAARGPILVTLLLSTVYGLGFFLVPSFVGLGRVSVLATAINRAANSVGDWAAASQLSLVALAVQLALMLAWTVGFLYVKATGAD